MHFKELQKQIYDFLEAKRVESYSLADKHFKLPLSDAIFCAQDAFRNRKFYEATSMAIADLKKEHESIVVVDAGSGTGVLGLFALLSGADKCYFLEHNPYALSLSKEFMGHFELLNKCEFIECDATSMALPEKFDLLISETISAGFLDEDFPGIVRNLKDHEKEHAIYIPQSFEIIISGNEPIFQKTPDEIQKISAQPGSTISMSAQLYNDVWIRPAESASFLNERKV